MRLIGLNQFDDLTQPHWDLRILAMLTEVPGPRRRSDLVQGVRDANGKRINDGVLSDRLSDLQDRGLVTRTVINRRHVDYEATPLARRRVEVLQKVDEFAATAIGENEPDPWQPGTERPGSDGGVVAQDLGAPSGGTDDLGEGPS